MENVQLQYCNYLNKQSEKLLHDLHLPSSKTKFKQYIKNGFIYDHSVATHKQPSKIIHNIRFNNIPIRKIDKIKLCEQHQKKYDTIKNNKKLNDKTKMTKIKTLNTHFFKEYTNQNNIIRSKKIWIPINQKQKTIIFHWFNVCDYVYNSCVNLFNEDTNKFYELSKKQLFDMLFQNKTKQCPYDTLTDEYQKFKSNAKSAFTNLKNKNIKYFRMTHKKQNIGRSILIAKKSITSKGIFPTLLGEIKNFDKILNINNIASDCRFVFDKLYSKFYLYVPQYRIKNKIVNREPIVSIDEGVDIFATYYSLNETGKIGENIKTTISQKQKEIKNLQSIKSKRINKNGNKLKNKKAIQKKINKKFRKIKNVVNELHHQTANYLCHKFDRILLPEFNTQEMITNDIEFKGNKMEIRKQLRDYTRKKKLNTQTKFVLQMCSHYRFKQHLLAKCEEYGCQLIPCTEEYTSQCCGKCGYLSSNYKNRIKICLKCNHKINRDVNGARNILIKNFKKVMKINW